MVLSDEEIDRFLKMPKWVTNPGARKKLQRGSTQINYALLGEGVKFQLFIRQNQRVKDAFSCGLLLVRESGEKIVLTRYNGSDHKHSNPLDKNRIAASGCHIHRATQRYMEAGRKAEHYAEPTTRYSDLKGALQALLSDCNVTGLNPHDQLTLFNR